MHQSSDDCQSSSGGDAAAEATQSTADLLFILINQLRSRIQELEYNVEASLGAQEVVEQSLGITQQQQAQDCAAWEARLEQQEQLLEGLRQRMQTNTVAAAVSASQQEAALLQAYKSENAVAMQRVKVCVGKGRALNRLPRLQEGLRL